MSSREKKQDSWMHGLISRGDTEKLLAKKPNGAFLVRESTNYPGDFTLSVAFRGKMEYYRIYRNVSGKYTCDSEEMFENINELVAHYSKEADGICCRLTTPVNCQSSDSERNELAVVDNWSESPADDEIAEKFDKHMLISKKATVLFSYSPIYDDELELNVGDVIEILGEAEDPGWMEGRLNGKTGFFAVSLVSLEASVDTASAVVVDQAAASVERAAQSFLDVKERSTKYCMECHSSFHKANFFHCATCFYDQTAMSRICANCWVQKHNGHEKKMMSSYNLFQLSEEEKELEPHSSEEAEPATLLLRATCAHDANYSNELSFEINDQIELITKEVKGVSGCNWWLGRIRGTEGFFPSNTVQEL